MLLPGTRLLEGRIIRVNTDRTLDVQTFDGPTLNRVRVVGSTTPRQNRDCLLLSDGAKFYCVGLLDQRDDPDADTPEDLAVAQPGRAELKDVNAMGAGSLVRVSAADGIELDAGSICASIYTSALGQITHFAERVEVCTPGSHELTTHDGQRCWSSTQHVSRLDVQGAVAALNYDEFSPIVGSELKVKIFEPEGLEQPITLELKDKGQDNARLTLRPDGDVTRVELLVSGADLMLSMDGQTINLSTLLETLLSLEDVIMTAKRAEVTADEIDAQSSDISLGTASSARIKIDGLQMGLGNGTVELVDALADVHAHLQSMINIYLFIQSAVAPVAAPLTGTALGIIMASNLATLGSIATSLNTARVALQAMQTNP